MKNRCQSHRSPRPDQPCLFPPPFWLLSLPCSSLFFNDGRQPCSIPPPSRYYGCDSVSWPEAWCPRQFPLRRFGAGQICFALLYLTFFFLPPLEFRCLRLCRVGGLFSFCLPGILVFTLMALSANLLSSLVTVRAWWLISVFFLSFSFFLIGVDAISPALVFTLVLLRLPWISPMIRSLLSKNAGPPSPHLFECFFSSGTLVGRGSVFRPHLGLFYSRNIEFFSWFPSEFCLKCLVRGQCGPHGFFRLFSSPLLSASCSVV